MAGTPELIGPPRYRVRFRDRPEARLRSFETLGNQPPAIRMGTRIGDVLIAARQADGNIEVISLVLIEDVVIEQSDRYERWHQTGTFYPTHTHPNGRAS